MIRTTKPEDHGLALDVIQIDGGTQSRASLNDQVVNEYAEAIKAGATFPPIVVFYDGKKHWLADGFHRFHAYAKAGHSHIPADVRQGTRRDAILHSVGANETHGLRRTRDDKRRAVLTLLNDAEWAKWSDREIGRQCAVSHEFVRKMRPVTVNVDSEDRTYTTKHGTTATMKTAGINASRKNAPETNSQPVEPDQHVGATAAEGLAGPACAHDDETANTKPAPRNIVAEVRELWNLATPSEREEIRAIINSSMESRESGYLAEKSIAPSKPAESDPDAQRQTAAEITPSAPPTAEPEAIPSPPPASGNHRSMSISPLEPREAGGLKGFGFTVSFTNPQPSSSQAADRPAPTSSPVSAKAGDVPPPASPATNSKPDCLDPEHCSVPFTSALCARCNDARMKRRVE